MKLGLIAERIFLSTTNILMLYINMMSKIQFYENNDMFPTWNTRYVAI